MCTKTQQISPCLYLLSNNEPTQRKVCMKNKVHPIIWWLQTNLQQQRLSGVVFCGASSLSHTTLLHFIFVKIHFCTALKVQHNISVSSRSGYRLDVCNILILSPSSFCCTFVYEFGIIVLFGHDPVQSKLQLSFRHTHISLHSSLVFRGVHNWLHGAQNISKPSLLHHND